MEQTAKDIGALKEIAEYKSKYNKACEEGLDPMKPVEKRTDEELADNQLLTHNELCSSIERAFGIAHVKEIRVSYENGSLSEVKRGLIRRPTITIAIHNVRPFEVEFTTKNWPVTGTNLELFLLEAKEALNGIFDVDNHKEMCYNGDMKYGSLTLEEMANTKVPNQSVGELTILKRENTMEHVSVGSLTLDKMVSTMDAALKECESIEDALKVFDDNSLPYQISQAPDVNVKKRCGDFTRKVKDCTIRRASMPELVVYIVIPDNNPARRDYWIAIGI